MEEIRSLGEKPARSALGLSLLFHGIALLLFVILFSPQTPRIVPAHYEVAEVIPLKPHVTFAPNRTKIHGNGGRVAHRSRQLIASGRASKLTAGEALKHEAQRQTVAIMNSLKFQMIYGFYPGHNFKLPIRQSGEIPHISADLFPPHYEQIVLVDLTIDTEGKVADAQIVAGVVDPAIQKLLLAAVRDFKYVPATRDDIPIPSQVEIVIPVPS
jgi:TonB family protein